MAVKLLCWCPRADAHVRTPGQTHLRTNLLLACWTSRKHASIAHEAKYPVFDGKQWEKRYRVYRITRFTLLGMGINFLPHFKAICRECLKLGTTESSIGEIVFNVRPSCFECNKYYPSRQQLFVSFYWLLCFFDVARSLKICSKPPYSLEMEL